MKKSVDTNQPNVQLGWENKNLVLTFYGVLQSARAVTGVWKDVAGAVSPFPIDGVSAQMFYRARPFAGTSIFSSPSVVEWVVTAPLQSNFDLAYAGIPDGIFPPQREKPYFDASLKMGSNTVWVAMRVRGNSSLQECPFPKLKLKVAKAQRVGTPFHDAREIKIGTHCADGGTGNVGRLRDERATYREALAYETMQLLGFVSPRVRRARIEFNDSSPTNTTFPGGWQITREALILDDIEVVAERLGGRALSESEVAALENAGFSEQWVADLQFLHILLGNWDYALSTDGKFLWNTEVIQLADGQYLPVAGDFDLSSWVTAKVKPRAPHDYHPDWPELYRQARYDLEALQTQVAAEIFASASSRFTRQRAAIEAQIQKAEIDADGRTNALNHVSAFFDALRFGAN